MSSEVSLLVSVLVPVGVVTVGALGILAFILIQKLRRSVTVPVVKYPIHKLEEGLKGKSVHIAAEVGFNNNFGDGWSKSHDYGNKGWESILLAKQTESCHESPLSTGDNNLAVLPSNLEVSTGYPGNQTSECAEFDRQDKSIAYHETPLNGDSPSSDHDSNGNQYSATDTAVASEIPIGVSNGADVPVLLTTGMPIDERMLFESCVPDSREQLEQLELDSIRFTTCHRLHPDTMEPILDEVDFCPKGKVRNLVWLQEEELLKSKSPFLGLSINHPTGGSETDFSHETYGSYTPTSEPSPSAYGARTRSRKGSRRASQSPKTPKWSRLARMHDQMFAKKHEVGNLSSPVELPGDNGVSFYRGTSSLMGVMLSAAADEAPVARKADLDDDDMWG